jgi:hypothetical protein
VIEVELEQLKDKMDSVYSGNAKVSVLPVLSQYLINAHATRAAMSTKTVVLSCQCLIQMLHTDATCAGDAIEAYAACLKSAKVGIREAAAFFLSDFLVYCNSSQTFAILSRLFTDSSSDTIKGSLSHYFKSELCRLWRD